VSFFIIFYFLFFIFDVLSEYLNGMGTWGAHGGSQLSAIGGISSSSFVFLLIFIQGTIRLGELLPGSVIRHALKVFAL
jgi:hypothetical protein